MRRIRILFLLMSVLPMVPGRIHAQETPPEPANEKFEKLLEKLSKIDFSGYIQAEYVEDERSSDRLVNGSSQNRDHFRVRRGRIKVTRKASELAQYVMQIDASSSCMDLKDAYIELTEPWTGWRHAVTAGQFKVPFGFEIPYSSSSREVPERSRVIRTLFPGERDRGVMIGATIPDTRLRYDVGLFNGSGVEGSGDVNSDKNLAARLRWRQGPVSVGASGYWGTDLMATAANPAGVDFDRTRYGAELQWATPLPGFTTRAEYVTGEHLGSDVDGWYVYAIQNLGDRHQLVVRIDEYDPNSDVSDNATRTLVGAWNVLFTSQTRFTVAWEHPRAEVNDPDDDVVTLRLQYKF